MSETLTQTHTVTNDQLPPAAGSELTPSALSPTYEPGHELPSYEPNESRCKTSGGNTAPPIALSGESPSASVAITAPPLRTECNRFLETPKGKRWLQIFVKSRASTPASLPVLFECDVIAGRVDLDLDKAEGCKGITIRIQGGTTFVGQEEEIFLKQEQPLWTPSGKEGKLSGKQSWPFEFTLPSEVSVKDGEPGKKANFPLPPSFTERASPAYIDYKIIVTIKRGFLRVNQTLVLNFAYQPLVIPDFPSPMRRMAYSDGSLLIGPDGDPNGWKTLPFVRIKGTLFNAKEVEIDCSLAIATPLCYAPGSPIPLVLTMSSSDSHALDVLAEPAAIQLLLRRSMATGVEATDDNGTRRTDNHFYENSGIAYFWQSWEADKNPNKRVLQGELEIPKTSKPSFKFPNFCIRYSLDLFPFKAAGFTTASSAPSEGKYQLYLSEPLAIATKQTPGVVPHSYAPPGYEKPQIVDYNKSLGLLENGNQRFLGHSHGGHGH